ncbi:arsenite-transporting ATPase [Thauera linaloolentis 47Lol = DSM 12138]|uniref:Arsenite-transporting ATPase n=1 Tax=Thauera linaloolentis (strain DSM 12138 / JCM 21573 / CCUG 41526 / CIP 105981 / IAM 15112 / NBRC 102519 / 47Lol) TaxID=1123367 RepID=N6YN52_THAL4|nr:arsenite-transporting ATPase [Thauera linaloolentis 47Lol = DSM 12138]
MGSWCWTQRRPATPSSCFTRVLIVTLPEATPVHEAERLQFDLQRAGIRPYGWVINQSLLASGTRHPLLAQRASYELPSSGVSPTNSRNARQWCRGSSNHRLGSGTAAGV